MLKPSRHIKVKCYYTFTQHCCHSGSCREDMRINECTVKNNFTTFDKNHVLTVDGLKMQWVYMCFFTTRCPTATCSESLQRCCWMKSPRAQIYWPIQHMDTNVKLIQQRVKAWIFYKEMQRIWCVTPDHKCLSLHCLESVCVGNESWPYCNITFKTFSGLSVWCRSFKTRIISLFSMIHLATIIVR